MRKLLKLCFKLNILVSAILMIYSIIVFVASLFEINTLLQFVDTIQEFATFGLITNLSQTLYMMFIGLIGFVANRYFYKVSLTLHNFDKFREITGIAVVPIFALGQLAINVFTLGIFALVPLGINVLATTLLHFYQEKNKNQLISEMEPGFKFDDPAMHEMSLKIGQLRMLKSEGKISEEEFMFHLNNILENKE